MEQEALIKPRVFISYSWSSESYQEWVVDLAKRLVHDGVQVVIDVWDLSVGQDKYVFMEQMVESNDIDKVLILCDEKYKQRANEREGGVGDETQIISSNIYGNVKQEKFIPIVATRDESGKAFIPNYITSRIYIDLSDASNFDENYESLLRNIYKVPLHQKPKLGNPPSFLFENKIDHFKTSMMLKRMNSLKDKNPNSLNSIAIDFSEALLDALEQFTFENIEGKPYDDIIHEKIQSMLPLQNDYTEVISILCEVDVIKSDYIIEFFEKIYLFSEFQGNGSYYEYQFDHYKFFIQELFILTVMLLLRYKKYKTLAEVVHADYYVDVNARNNEPIHFDRFRFHLQSIADRNSRLKLNKISLQADLMIQCAGNNKREFVEADLLLYYIDKFVSSKMFAWFPYTYIYQEGHFRFMNRLRSKRHFDEVKIIFNVETKDEFIERASTIKTASGYERSFYSIPSINSYINLEDIATKL